MPKGGTIIVNTDAFNDRTLQKAGYGTSPLEDGSLADYHVHEVALTSMTVGALKGIEGVTPRERLEELLRPRADVVALPPSDGGHDRLHRLEVRQAARDRRGQHQGVQGGLELRRDLEDFAISYEVAPAPLAPGTYRQITGNTALSFGLIAASKLSGLPLFLGAYLDHTGLLDPRGARRPQGVRRRAFQAEDEIAAVGAAVGASFGALGVTASAGPAWC